MGLGHQRRELHMKMSLNGVWKNEGVFPMRTRCLVLLESSFICSFGYHSGSNDLIWCYQSDDHFVLSTLVLSSFPLHFYIQKHQVLPSSKLASNRISLEYTPQRKPINCICNVANEDVRISAPVCGCLWFVYNFCFYCSKIL